MCNCISFMGNLLSSFADPAIENNFLVALFTEVSVACADNITAIKSWKGDE